MTSEDKKSELKNTENSDVRDAESRASKSAIKLSEAKPKERSKPPAKPKVHPPRMKMQLRPQPKPQPQKIFQTQQVLDRDPTQAKDFLVTE
mmetsp:Transcript_27244/g.41444  ORF Transcript_27244/g.41444 Transcript_27244/m.41444 type:complete len:91 (+) Transcript_27244:961-1233(+)